MSGSNTRTIEQVQHVGNMRWDSGTETWVPITADDLAGVGSTATAINDGADGTIKATVSDLTNSNPLATMIVDGNGDQITSFGGSAGLTDAQLRATPVPVSGTVAVTGADTSLLALESGGVLDDILAELGGKTEPANQQHVIVDSSASVAVTGSVTANGYADLVTNGTLTVQGDSVSVSLAGYQGCGCVITGTWTGQVTFKVSTDGGSTYAATFAQNRATLALVSTTASNASVIFLNLGGADHVQVYWTTLTTGGPISVRFTQTYAPYPPLVIGGTIGSTVPSVAGYLGAYWTNIGILEPLQVNHTVPGSTDFGLAVRQIPEISSRSDTYTVEGNGTAVNVATHSRQYFAIQVACSTATAISWDIVLEGSLDGTNYDTILEHTQTSGDKKIIWLNECAPCLYFRSRCKSLILGDSTGVIATILGRY